MKVTEHATPITQTTTTYTLSEITEDELRLLYSLLLAVDGSGKWGTMADAMKGPCNQVPKCFLSTDPIFIKVEEIL